MENLYKEIDQRLGNGESLMVITVVEKIGDGPVTVGKKMVVTPTKQMGTVGGGGLELQAVTEARELLAQEQCLLKSYILQEGKIQEGASTLPMLCGGKITLFYEYLSGGKPVYIFGAGHVGAALDKQLHGLGFHTHLIDHRPEILEPLQPHGEKHLEDMAEFAARAPIPVDSYVLICTPSHRYDFDVLKALLDRGPLPVYVGMLASKRKRQELKNELDQVYGENLDLSNFHCPVGLDLGGQSPKEIALSIAAEMVALKNGKEGHLHMKL